MGMKSRRKGARIETEIVDRHKAIGVHAEKYPLSGMTRFRGSGHDIDIYAFGNDEAPLVTEVKGRKDGHGFAMLERWLDNYDLLFLRRDGEAPMVVLPWRIWEEFLTWAGKGTSRRSNARPPAATFAKPAAPVDAEPKGEADG